MLNDSTNKEQEKPNKALDRKSSTDDFGGPIKVVSFTLIVFILSQIIAVVILALVKGTSSIDDVLEDSLVIGLINILLVEAFTITLVYKLIGATKKSWEKIGLIRPRLKDIPIAGAGFVGYYIILLVASIIIYTLFPQIDTDQRQDLGFEDVNTNIQLLITFISLVILPPIGEEILMRGYLLTGLRKRLKFVPSMLIVSTLFALAHLQPGSGQALLWAAAINTFFLSIVLVYVKEKHKSLWPCIYIHGLNNLIAFMFLYIFV